MTQTENRDRLNITDREPRPLIGLRVLDLVQGPMAAITRYFAELGADVVRIEPADGGADRTTGTLAGGMSLEFAAANLSKRAATPDQFDALVVEADLVVAPVGAVDVASLRANNPRLIVLSVSDFGDTEGFTEWNGSNAVYLALGGHLSRSGLPGREPLLPPGDLAHACAVAQAACAALIAYWQVLRTGQGDHLDFSVLDGAAQTLDPGYGIAGSATAGVPASQLPRGRPDVRFQYPIVPCLDGWVRLCILAPRQWQGMFEWLGQPEEFADPKYQQLQARYESPTLLPAIARFFADKTRARLEEEGQSYGVPTAAMLDLDEALATDQIAARRAFVPMEIAPGLTAPFPDGVIEVDGLRMGITAPVPGKPNRAVSWYPRDPLPTAPTGGERPLDGIRVLDLGVIVVGAETGRLFADHGADVIKVESSAFPDGSRQSRVPGLISATFAAGHRNKRSLGINLRDPRGKAMLLDLIGQSDVVLTNFKGGTLESLGLDYAALRAVNPGVIVVDSSAFGPTGPWSRRMGYGPLVRAASGLTMQWRYSDLADSFSDALTIYPDHVAARIGTIGVIALLIRRLRSGQGGQISISQAEVMLSQMAAQIAATALRQSGHPVTADPTRSDVYACAGDDEWCAVTLRDARDEAAALKVTGGRALPDWLAEQPPLAAMATLQAAGVPAGAMLRVSEMTDFAYYRNRDLFRNVTHPHLADGLTFETRMVRSAHQPDPPERPAPLLGEHTVSLIAERLGLPADEIASLIAEQVLERPAAG